MRSAWIVVVNSSRARLFERVSERGHIEPLASIERADPRLYGVTDPAEPAFARLARQVADYINDGVLNDRCARLQLFAAPSILGAIREHMHYDTRRVSAEHDAPDMTSFSTEELETSIAGLCGEPAGKVG